MSDALRSSPPLQGSKNAERDSNSPAPGKTESANMPSTPPTIQSATNGPPTVREKAAQNNDEIEQDDVDPQEKIATFDWSDLEKRYHDMIQERGDIEESLWNEFDELLNYFTVWANTTQVHEVDRSFKRLKTRIHHVQVSEEQLEQKRQHYIKVVAAFQSALNLLNGP